MELSISLCSIAKLQASESLAWEGSNITAAVDALAGAVAGKVDGFKPQELANSLWALADLQEKAPEPLAGEGGNITAAVGALVVAVAGKVERLKRSALAHL
jgi:hypothetical protein